MGQLQNEMQRGDWYVLPADAETIFERDVSRIWPDLVRRASARPTRHLIQRDGKRAEALSRGPGIRGCDRRWRAGRPTPMHTEFVMTLGGRGVTDRT
jgi:hypothetical protein